MAASTKISAAGSRVDANALRANQALIILIVVVAFVLGAGNGGGWVIAALAVSMAIAAARPGYGPLQLLYKHGIIATGLVNPKPQGDDPAPHRFAQAVGASFLAASAILLLVGAIASGWILAWIVAALALTNLVFGFCAGCFVFLQLRKTGLVS